MARAPIRVRSLTKEDVNDLNTLYRKATQPRVRARVQAILLAWEKQMLAPEIASIVRWDEHTVRRWIKRFNEQGIEGLHDAPRSGARPKATAAYQSRLLQIVRQRPRSLNLPYSLWTLSRLADFMSEETGITVTIETIRRLLKNGGIVLSRPQHTISSPDPEYRVKKRRLKPNETP